MRPSSRSKGTTSASTSRRPSVTRDDSSGAGPSRLEPYSEQKGRMAWGDMYAMSRGTFAGTSIRHCLELCQEPTHGRRRTDKDRRPLAHCPILRLRIYSCFKTPSGDWTESAIDLTSVECTSYVCASDLLPDRSTTPVLPTPATSSTIYAAPVAQPARAETILDTGQSTPISHGTSSSRRSSLAHLMSASAPPRGPPILPTDLDTVPGPSSLSHVPHFPSQTAPPILQNTSQGKQRERERSSGSSPNSDDPAAAKKLRGAEERNLFGSLHVSAIKVPAPDGECGVWFLFNDLTVRLEGVYQLRLRVYDLSTIAGYSGQHVQPLVEILTSPFVVHSPRAFPGVPPTTPLIEHFTSMGFKLTSRKNEKQARQQSQPKLSRKTTPERPDPHPVQPDACRHPSQRQSAMSTSSGSKTATSVSSGYRHGLSSSDLAGAGASSSRSSGVDMTDEYGVGQAGKDGNSLRPLPESSSEDVLMDAKPSQKWR
ncbi:velvet factor-domain-containing protein [Kockovaella imperatae]|uniref:Velvet factor-domain-containing protein n=1 Tax=Kockovaella imperatae TaxID=4999 RepID=A0A1Y1UAV2_9TREE|nr:velvet factor-domain-containing protein [Kockovaella imperatae]ORX34674.1 velvet factor-domain-containing protein [Kockovaella imperatae]